MCSSEIGVETFAIFPLSYLEGTEIEFASANPFVVTYKDVKCGDVRVTVQSLELDNLSWTEHFGA